MKISHEKTAVILFIKFLSSLVYAHNMYFPLIHLLMYFPDWLVGNLLHRKKKFPKRLNQSGSFRISQSRTFSFLEEQSKRLSQEKQKKIRKLGFSFIVFFCFKLWMSSQMPNTSNILLPKLLSALTCGEPLLA